MAAPSTERRRLRLTGELGAQPGVLYAFMGAHLMSDFASTSLPAFLPAIEDDFGLSYFELGVLSLAFTVLSGVVQPFAGNYADREGRRRATLVFGFASTGLGFVLIGVSPVFWLIVLSSLFCGLGGAMYHPQATAILVKTYPRQRGRTLGIHGWGGSIGHLLAPAVVAISATAFGWRWAIILLAIPSVVAAVGLSHTLDESAPNPGATLRGAFSRDLLVMAVTYSLLAMVLRAFIGFLPTFFVDEQNSSLTSAGLLTTLVLVVGMVAQPVGGSVFDRLGGRRVFLVAAIGTTASVGLFAVSSGIMALFAATSVAFFGFSLFPVSLAMASEVAGAQRTGAAAGIVFGISGFATAVIPAIVGAIADRSDLQVALSTTGVLSIAAIGSAMLLPNKIESPK